MRAGRAILIVLLLLSCGCKKSVPRGSRTPLLEAVMRGDIEQTRTWIARGENVNAANEYGQRPLGLAVRCGNLELVELLLAHGADVNAKCEADSSTPLHMAAEQGWKSIAKLLIAHGAELEGEDKLGRTPAERALKADQRKMVRLLAAYRSGVTIHVAAYLGEIDTVKRLLKERVTVDAKDADGQSALEYAAREGHTGIVELLLAEGADANGKGGDDTPLIDALWHCHPDVAILLVNHGARVEGKHSTSGESPLRMAAKDGLIELAKLLIAHGAEVEATDNAGNTALHCAVVSGKRAMVELLLSRSADMNAKGCFANTPLHAAAESGYKDVVQLLIDKHAAVNPKNEFGQTPAACAMESGHKDIVLLLAASGVDLTIHLAAYAGDLQTVGCLLDAGADVNHQDKQGRTPLYLAVQEGNRDIAELLINRGADIRKGRGQPPWVFAPLHAAACYGRTDTINLLIRKGADVHAKDMVNATPLHEAARGGHREAVVALVAAGAEINQQDQYARTPLFAAAVHGHRDVVEVLLSRGADVTAGKMGHDLTLPDPRPEAPADIMRLLMQAYAPYTVIVTDRAAVRGFLKWRGVSFDDVWIPEQADIQGLDPVLKSSLEKGPPERRGSWLDTDYVLRNLGHYHREFSGFVEDGARYLICQMVLSDEFGARSPHNGFSEIAGGGSEIVRIIFNAEQRTVEDVGENGPF
jgi:ankyrin repeat protein